MKTKWILLLIIVVFIVALVLSFKAGYLFGGLNKSLTIKAVNAKQLAEAMQGDNFYGEFSGDMLLLDGVIKSVKTQGDSTLVYFNVTNGVNVLPQVFCQMQNKSSDLQVGQTIKILTVAHSAKRVNKADVNLQNCYLLN